MAEWLGESLAFVLMIVDAALMLAAVVCVMRICWDVYKLRTRRQSAEVVSQSDVGRVVAGYVAKGRRVVSVTHLGKAEFLVVSDT